MEWRSDDEEEDKALRWGGSGRQRTEHLASSLQGWDFARQVREGESLGGHSTIHQRQCCKDRDSAAI